MKWAWSNHWLLLLPVAGLFATMYGPVALAPAGYVPATRENDFFLYYFPMTEAAFDLLRQGELPLWNPYLFSGMPFLASIEIGVLYPPNWLHLVLPAARAFCVLYILHVLLAGVGTWLYARGRGRSVAAALFSATVFAFASPTILHEDTGMTSIVYSSAWIPLIMAMLDRTLRLRTATSICWLAIVLACQFLAGFPMFTYVLAVLIPAYLLVFGGTWQQPVLRGNARRMLPFAGAAVLALGLVAPQLLATLEYLGESFRGELEHAQATHCCFPAPNLVTLLIPEFFGNDRGVDYWGETYLFDANAFCGASTILLCLMAALRWRDREFLFWSLAGVVVMGIALGKYSALYDLCYLYVPGVNRFRGVARLSIFGVFCLSLLAGMGLDQVLNQQCRFGQRVVCLIVGVLSAVALTWGIGQMDSVKPVPEYWRSIVEWVRWPGAEVTRTIPWDRMHDFLVTSRALMLRGLCISAGTLLAAVLLVELPRARPRFQSVAAFSWLCLLVAEFQFFQAKYVVLMDVEPKRHIARCVRNAVHDDGLYRVAGFSSNPPFILNRFLYEKMQSAGGHENFVLDRYAWFLQRWVGLDPNWQTNLTVPNFHGLYDLLNIKYYVSPPSRAFTERNDVVLQDKLFEYGNLEFTLYCNRDVLPRAFVVHHTHHACDQESSLDLLRHLNYGTLDTDSVIEGPQLEGVAVASTQQAPSTGSQLNGTPAPRAELEPEADRVEIVEYRCNRIVVRARCGRPGWLLFSENWYPGWQATVNGRQSPMYPANLFMRGVPVSAGEQRVELVYRPVPFRIGCLFAAASLAFIAAVAVRSLARAQWRTLFFRSTRQSHTTTTSQSEV